MGIACWSVFVLFMGSWDAVLQKVFINFLCGITLRSTFVRAPSYGLNTADSDYMTIKISSAASHFDVVS